MKNQITIVRRKEQIITVIMQEGILHQIRAITPKPVVNGNIYLGKVLSVVPNIRGAFIEVEEQITCYLPLDEMNEVLLANRKYDGVLKQSDQVVVQVVKEAMKQKDATVSTNLSFQGRYAVVTTKESRISCSKKLLKKERTAIVPMVEPLLNPSIGILVRTNAKEGMTNGELVEEIQLLKKQYEQVVSKKDTRSVCSCLQRAIPEYLQLARDYLGNEYEIRTDDKSIYLELKKYCEQDERMSTYRNTISYYEDSYPLSKLISLETVLEEALKQRVWLKSGGNIVIEPTEALTVVDVNSGKRTSKKPKEEDVLKINLEAGKMMLQQVRIRNISGIIIVDFINMKDESSYHKLIALLQEEAKKDYMRVHIAGMTSLGLIELTRMKQFPPLTEQLQS